MRILSDEQKLEQHMAFWQGTPMKRPLISIRTGSVFPSTLYRANKALLAKGRQLNPADIHVNEYLKDYLRIWEEYDSTGHDAFFVADPCTGIPWMEAILGAKVYGADCAFITEPPFHSIDDLHSVEVDKQNNLWYQKYLEFTKALVDVADGCFPVGQPILRGSTDTIGALVGQEEMACALMEEPGRIHVLFDAIANTQRELVIDQFSLIPPFYAGYGIGLYNIWAPGRVIWLQEDLSALTAPKHYKEFLRPVAETICAGFDFTLMHLHPASFFQLDSILEVDAIKVVQINKDNGGPSVSEMMPLLKKVIECGKKLVLGMGDLNREDIDAVYRNLPGHSTALSIVTPTVQEAQTLIEYMNTMDFSK